MLICTSAVEITLPLQASEFPAMECPRNVSVKVMSKSTYKVLALLFFVLVVLAFTFFPPEALVLVMIKLFDTYLTRLQLSRFLKITYPAVY